MSTSVTRRSSATGHPTRQQLDELDALLQRMLDLPVNRNDEEADAAPAPAAETPTASGPEPLRGPHRPTRARPPAEPPAVNYHTAEEEEADLKPRVVSDAPPGPEGKPSGDRPQDWVPLSSAWQPSARTWKPLSEAWKQAQASVGRAADAPAVEGEPALAAEPSPEPHAENDTPAPETAAASAPEEAAAPTPPTEAPRILRGPVGRAALAALAAARFQRRFQRLSDSLRPRRPLAARTGRSDDPRRRRTAGPGRRRRPDAGRLVRLDRLSPLR